MLRLRHAPKLLCSSCGLKIRSSVQLPTFLRPASLARHFAIPPRPNELQLPSTSLNLVAKLRPYTDLMRFDRPVGTLLLFWPCGWSIALSAQAGHWPDFYTLGLFAAGAFIMRGAGCTINDMWDRDIDAKVERTKMRPLVSGQIAMVDAWTFLAAQLSAGLAILMTLNTNSIFLGKIGMS